jgi:hypothetical protein
MLTLENIGNYLFIVFLILIMEIAVEFFSSDSINPFAVINLIVVFIIILKL